jgi:threonine dehydratase
MTPPATPAPSASAAIDRAAIEATIARIRPYVRYTPTLAMAGPELNLAGRSIVLKLEQLQHGGSFKARGAFANLLLREIPNAGVVAASGGNHGVAVALAASRLGIPAKIFVPAIASPAKIQKIRECGADLIVAGDRYADALAASAEWAERSGALPVHAFDQRETLLGQGTVAWELSEQAPDLDTVLVAVGGGGLIGGVAAWFQGRVKVVGVEPDGAPTLAHALAAGRPVDAPAGSIAADSLAPRRVGELMFPIAQSYIDRVVLVTDDHIRRAQEFLWHSARIAAEPGGAAAFAALLGGAYEPHANERIGVIVCGANFTPGQPA